MNNFMGLGTMDEDTTNQNGALGCDIAAKAGLLVKNQIAQWAVEKYADSRRIYFVGDAKTADLFEKCLYNLQNNPNFSEDREKFEELDTFVNTMKRLYVRPGDWHAGLTMFQSVMSTFWDAFLQPLVLRPGWKRV